MSALSIIFYIMAASFLLFLLWVAFCILIQKFNRSPAVVVFKDVKKLDEDSALEFAERALKQKEFAGFSVNQKNASPVALSTNTYLIHYSKPIESGSQHLKVKVNLSKSKLKVEIFETLMGEKDEILKIISLARSMLDHGKASEGDEELQARIESSGKPLDDTSINLLHQLHHFRSDTDTREKDPDYAKIQRQEILDLIKELEELYEI